MKRLRVAVIGAGHLGRIHAQKLSRLAGVRLVGVVDPVAQVRDAVASECKTAAFADLLEVVDKIDAAVVAAPTSLHHAVGLQLLARGLHVLMEKPLAATLEEADELVEAARRAGVVLQAGHIERFNPAVEPVLPALRDPKYIEATRTSGFIGRCLDVGVVLDLMIHDIDLVLSLVRSPLRQVQAMGMTVLSKHEDVANARLTFENGCIAHLNASRISPQPSRSMHIWSQAGFVSLDFAARTAKVMRPKDEVLSRAIDVDSLTAAERLSLKETWQDRYFDCEEFSPPACDQITAELEDFVGAIRDGRPPRVTGAHGRDAQVVAHRILDAIQEHRWDGHHSRRAGSPSVSPPHVIPGPHWNRPSLRVVSQEWEEALESD